MNIQTFDFQVDVMRALIWQYNNAERLIGLLERKQAFYDEQHRDFWQNWIRDVFDLRTANDFGLTVWAKILEVPLVDQEFDSPDDYMAWSFSDVIGVDPTLPTTNFNNGNFATTTGLVALNTEQKRLLLRLRYFNLTTTATVPEINQFLNILFPDGPGAFVRDNNDMTIDYVFDRTPNSEVLYVLNEFDALPMPSAVSANIVIDPDISWGFGTHRFNFNRVNFFGT